ncbi:MAG: YegS/Rv2252/BmrU family lipid kinase [Chitinophagaceae bacterium]|nr:YegS/Rv2252/BmrU family lipid kinase [Chitinophagaceae bacterium]
MENDVLKIALVVNPKAGKGKSLRVLQQLTFLLEHRNIHFISFIDEWPPHFKGFTDVWIIGGDGTLNYFINHYPDIRLPLVIFKGGTGNDFAWKLYGNCNLKEQLEMVLSSAPQPVDAAQCNELLFINGVGLGFDGTVLKAMKTIRLIGGHIGYYLLVLKTILSFKESSFVIQSHGKKEEQKFLLVMINNSSRTGGGFHVSPKATVNDGLLDLITATPLTILQRFFYLPKIQKGNHMQLPFIHHVTGEEFIISSDKELPAQLDGELINASTFHLKVLKQKFLFRYPL